MPLISAGGGGFHVIMIFLELGAVTDTEATGLDGTRKASDYNGLIYTIFYSCTA